MLNNTYRKAIKLEEVSLRKPTFRGSGVPFCPMKLLIDSLNYYHGVENWNYNGDFYCDIGTAIHSVLQKWLPRADPLYVGNWECKKCNIKIYAKAGPLHCPSCNQEMMYDEFNLDFLKCNANGHCDGVFLDKDSVLKHIKTKTITTESINDLLKKQVKLKGKILEFKSTGQFAVRNLKKPHHKHKLQATTYVGCANSCLKTMYNVNIDITGYVIKYFARENPNLVSQDFENAVDDQLYKIMCKIVNHTYNFIKNPGKKYKKFYNFRPCDIYPTIFQECENESFCKDFSFKEFKSDWKFVIEKIPDLKYNSLKLL